MYPSIKVSGTFWYDSFDINASMSNSCVYSPLWIKPSFSLTSQREKKFIKYILMGLMVDDFDFLSEKCFV